MERGLQCRSWELRSSRTRDQTQTRVRRRLERMTSAWWSTSWRPMSRTVARPRRSVGSGCLPNNSVPRDSIQNESEQHVKKRSDLCKRLESGSTTRGRTASSSLARLLRPPGSPCRPGPGGAIGDQKQSGREGLQNQRRHAIIRSVRSYAAGRVQEDVALDGDGRENRVLGGQKGALNGMLHEGVQALVQMPPAAGNGVGRICRLCGMRNAASA